MEFSVQLSKRRYQAIALSTLCIPIALMVWLAPFITPWFVGLNPAQERIMTVLGWVLTLLLAIIAWALALLPLRARAGFIPVTDEFRRMQAQGGFRAALAHERAQMEADKQSPDADKRERYHQRMGWAGFFLSVLCMGISYLLLTERSGSLWLFPLAASVIAPPITLYHFLAYMRARAQL